MDNILTETLINTSMHSTHNSIKKSKINGKSDCFWNDLNQKQLF